MVGKERWEEVHRAFVVERLTVSAIARWFDLDWKTVRRCRLYERSKSCPNGPTNSSCCSAVRPVQ